MCLSSWTRLASSQELLHLLPLGPQIIQRDGDDAPQQPVLGGFVLFLIVFGGLFVGRLRVQHVVLLGDLLLEPQELVHRELAVLNVGDQAVELGDPPLERPHAGRRWNWPGGAGTRSSPAGRRSG